MKKDMLDKALVLGIICLFIGVGFQPVISIEINNSNETVVNEECIECRLSEQFTEYEINRLLIRTKSIVNYISILFADIPNVKENCYQILYFINNNPFVDMICAIANMFILGVYRPLEKIFENNQMIYTMLIAVFTPIIVIDLWCTDQPFP